MSRSVRTKVELLSRLRPGAQAGQGAGAGSTGLGQQAQATDEVHGGAPSTSPSTSTATSLEPLFDPWRRLVRRRLSRRYLLDGWTAGAVLGGCVAALGIWLPTWHRPGLSLGLGFVGLGLLAGAWLARRARWDDAHIALFVDGVLRSPELVTTAVTLGHQAPAKVLSEAAEVLRAPRRGPSWARRRHALGVAFSLGIALLAVWPARAPVHAAPSPGLDVVRLAHVPGLDKISEIARLPTRDPAQKERLLRMAEESRALQRELLAGAKRREALDRLGALKRELDVERRSFIRGDNALGLSAAASALRSSGFPGLADALEAGDLSAFDEMMERLANDREAKDRERARDALEQSLAAARTKKADDLARALERQKKRFDEREGKADVLRELADALGGTPADPGAHPFDAQGTDAQARELADALRRGLEKLSPEERRRLAEKLREREGQQGRGEPRGRPSPRSKERRKELERDLSTPEGQKRLQERLRELANEGPSTDEEQRDRGLGDAEDGADEADDALGGRSPGDGNQSGKPTPGGKPGQGAGRSPGAGLPGASPGGPGHEPGGAAGGRDGHGEHHGKSRIVDADTMKARARGRRNSDAPQLPSGGHTSTPGSDGAKATVGPTGDLSGVSAGELRGVERAEIPEPVRRQVKTYFE